MSEDTINLFMWGYQRHFRISVELKAKDLFQKIDKRFASKVFLVGILRTAREDRHAVCLEPEDCGYDPNAFKNIDALSDELQKVDEENNVFNSDPGVQANHERRIRTRAHVDAIDKILKREDPLGDTEKYVSYPCMVEDYEVYVVLELQSSIVRSHYALTHSRMDRRFRIDRSLIESATHVFLAACSESLKDPNKGIMAVERPVDELLREAGKEFMYTAAQAGQNYFGLHGLYDSCNLIASLRYEGQAGFGSMLIAPKDHKNIKMVLELQEPISVNSHRKVRKLLELSGTRLSLVSDSSLIYGLGELRGKYNPTEEAIFTVKFLSHFKWELLHDGNGMMVVEYREPMLPTERVDREKFSSDIHRIFAGIGNQQVYDLWDVVTEAIEQKHGTLVLITENAAQVSNRLGKQCFPLKPLRLSASEIQRVTTIDGAILLDTNARCHALGVILDGLATEKGDASRGARYNSAVRYYETFKASSPCILIVISEDGMVDLIPNLRPQIKHSAITNSIKALEELLAAPKVDFRLFYKTMDFFQEQEFYLTKDECDAVNGLRVQIESRDAERETIRIVYRDFSPNEEMDISYYNDAKASRD